MKYLFMLALFIVSYRSHFSTPLPRCQGGPCGRPYHTRIKKHYYLEYKRRMCCLLTRELHYISQFAHTNMAQNISCMYSFKYRDFHYTGQISGLRVTK